MITAQSHGSPAHTFDRRAFRVLVQSRYLAFALVLTLAWTFFQGIDGLITFYMSDELGASGGTIGLYGTLKGVGMVVGAVALSSLVRRFGRRFAALTTLSVVTLGGLVLSTFEAERAILFLAVPWGVAVCLQWTTYVTLAMGITDTRIVGSMFAILQTMSNIGIGAGEGVATALSDDIGYSGVFRWFALGNVIVVPLIVFALGRFEAMHRREEEDLVVDGV